MRGIRVHFGRNRHDAKLRAVASGPEPGKQPLQRETVGSLIDTLVSSLSFGLDRRWESRCPIFLGPIGRHRITETSHGSGRLGE